MAIGDFFKKKKMHKDEVSQESLQTEDRSNGQDVFETESMTTALESITSAPESMISDGRFAYKTRGESSPQGKQRVYFCCHPRDFSKYFNQISDEILKKQNCAIWYDNRPQSACDETFFDNLSQMQLFVIPVTTAFLSTKNKALDVEFAYAMEHHIPVLPLLQETKIVNLFNRKCGDLQFLNARDKDTTAIDYDEKLGLFLQNVLVGDELSQKIRQAFDGYIFLSYRKKDRRYAQELMRLIHKQPLCSGIAVWYDEFLVPGEDFTDSIQDALKKSDLFVMAVTPNLVNETNYVMTTEYPLACHEEKHILPVEMATTDGNALKEKYENIPELISGENESQLSAALMQAVKRLAIDHHEGDLEHQYYIGLAYLKGVDVEVDYGRAVELITQAAKAGLPEAGKTLVSMYRNGEGVKRDYDIAIQLQKDLVALLQKTAESDLEEKATYWEECVQLGKMLADLHRRQEAKDVYSQVLKEAEETFEKHDSPKVQAFIVNCHCYLGDMHRREKEFDQAREHFEKYYDLMKQREEARQRKENGPAQERLNDIEKRQMINERTVLAAAMGNLAELARDEDDLEKALTYYQQMLTMFEEMTKITDDMLVRRNLSVTHGNIGEILDSEGYLFEGREHHLIAHKQMERLVKEYNTTVLKRDLLIGIDNLALSYLSEGDCRNAEKYALKSLDLAKKLAEETESLESKIDLGMSYKNLGDIANFAGNKMKAMDYYTEITNLKEDIDACLK